MLNCYSIDDVCVYLLNCSMNTLNAINTMKMCFDTNHDVKNFIVKSKPRSHVFCCYQNRIQSVKSLIRCLQKNDLWENMYARR